MSGVTCCSMTPIQPGRTAPNFSSRPITNCAMFEGMAKPMPTEPVVGE